MYYRLRRPARYVDTYHGYSVQYRVRFSERYNSQAVQELQAARRQLAEAAPAAEARDALAAELAGVQGELRDAERRLASVDVLARMAASAFEARLGSTERERDQLLEQVRLLGFRVLI